MTEEYYQSLQAEYKDFVDTCCETYPIFRNWASFMTWADKIEQKISNLEAELAEWRADAERLAKTFVIEVYPHEWVCRSGCHHMGKSPATINHAPDCPITLHRELVEKYKKEVVR